MQVMRVFDYVEWILQPGLEVFGEVSGGRNDRSETPVARLRAVRCQAVKHPAFHVHTHVSAAWLSS